MVSCIIHDIVNSFKPTYCNDLKGLILELSRQALVGGGEAIKVFSHTFCNRQMARGLGGLQKNSDTRFSTI